jgi:hypothetical protein
MALRATSGGGGGGGGSGTVTTVSVATANGLNGTVANATTTPSITIGTSVTGVLKGNGTAISAATANTDYLTPPSGTALLKAGSGGALANAAAGTDYQAPISLTTTGTSGAATFAANVLNIPNYAAGAGSGTVTSASVVSANGFAGTVANATTTPAITLSTSISGLLKGNGTAISAASSSTDYQVPITLTTTGSTGAATFAAGTLNIPNYSVAGTVTSITAGTGLSGGTITSSGTIAIDSTVATLTGTQTLTNKTITGLTSGSTVLDSASNPYAVGFRTMPLSTNATGTMALSDSAKFFYVNSSITVPLNATVAFEIGTVITVVSNSTAITIIPTSGVTLQLANSATAGTRSLASNGVATLLKVAVNTWYVSGAGVT